MRKLIKFEADWCGPCHAIRPAVNAIAEETGLQIDTIDIDAEENKEILKQFAVSSIPTVLLVLDGAEVGRHLGSAPKSVIMKNLGL